MLSSGKSTYSLLPINLSFLLGGIKSFYINVSKQFGFIFYKATKMFGKVGGQHNRLGAKTVKYIHIIIGGVTAHNRPPVNSRRPYACLLIDYFLIKRNKRILF